MAEKFHCKQGKLRELQAYTVYTSTPDIKLVELSEDVCYSDDETNKPPSTRLSDKDGDDDENDLDIPEERRKWVKRRKRRKWVKMNCMY